MVKGQKTKILKRTEIRHSIRLDVFCFLITAHFLKQLPPHIAHIAKAPQSNADAKALLKSLESQPHADRETVVN
jgi:hypothetical protein